MRDFILLLLLFLILYKKKGKKMQRGKKEKTLQKARVALSSYYWRFYKEVFLLKKSQ